MIASIATIARNTLVESIRQPVFLIIVLIYRPTGIFKGRVL